MQQTTTTTVAFDIAGAAEAVSLSPDTIRRAIRKTKPDDQFPPMLRAKRTPKGYRVKVADLDAWFDSLPDA